MLLVFALLAVQAGAAEPPTLPWSFAPIRKPAAPPVKNTTWLRDGLDTFILARLEAAGVAPNPDADRPTLLRRVSYDLTGLPPTPEEIVAFASDPSPDDAALAKVVDRLLASPRFGERWGRHWLDVVRYADSVGRTWNSPFIYAWRYRDWVIDSFNEDKPFALFAAEQLAGDLLPARTVAEKRSRLTGTGFLALGSMALQESLSEQYALDRVDDQIDVTTRAFLGLTMACARCHDHKTDPIAQRDYYALAGIFYSSETLSGGQRGVYVDPDLLHQLPGETATAPTAPKPKPTANAASADPDGMTGTSKDHISRGAMDEKGFYRANPNLAMGMSEGEMRDCAIRIKGEANQRGDTPRRGELQLPGFPKFPVVGDKESGRLALAQWVASPSNPLTARVLANRVWLHLFGRGLVRTVDNFGLTGEKPTHPELLDHLAVRFTENGWSVKKLIRAIVLSHTYRESSASEPGRMARDGANELYWRMNPKRLELEAIRDSLLFASGRLTFDRPPGIQLAGNGGKGQKARTRSLLDETASYRTVYLPVLRDLLPEIYKTFDFPEPTQIQGQREVTTVPGQALFFLNSRLVTGSAADTSERLLADASFRSDDARIARAYAMLLSREPSRDEIAEARAFLTSTPDPSRWTAFIQALIAGTEYRYVW
jgi:hypothetical protein